MWRLQLSEHYSKFSPRLSSRRLFFLQLCGIALGAHFLLIFLTVFLSWFMYGKDHLAISLHEQAATYVLMPLHKTIERTTNKNVVNHSNSYKKSNVIDHETFLHKKKSRKKHKASASSFSKNKTMKQLAKSLIKPIKPAKPQQQASVIMRPAPYKKAELVSKRKQKKPAKIKIKSVSEKITPHASQLDPVTPKEVTLEKIALEQGMPEETKTKVELPSKIEKVEQLTLNNQDLVQELLVQDEKSEIADEQVSEDEDIDLDNVVFIGSQDLDSRILGSKIQQMIVENWNSPAGIAPGTSCKIRVKIDNVGQAVSSQVMKQSGVFIFDSSLRSATLACLYPQEIWNKTISFTFEE